MTKEKIEDKEVVFFSVDDTKILSSAHYKSDIERIADSITSKIKKNDSEATVASVFETEIYHFLKNVFGRDIKFAKEAGSSYLRHSFKGRMDSFVSDMVIEYKSPRKFETNSDQRQALDQLSGYMYQLSKEKSCKPVGVIVDGRKIQFLQWHGDSLKSSRIGLIDRASIDKLIRFYLKSDDKRITSERVLEDFSLSDKHNPSYLLANKLFEILMHESTDRTEMLYTEWLSLFHLSDVDSGKNSDIVKRHAVLEKLFQHSMRKGDADYRALFALQTTYAIVVKLIACKAIQKLAFNEDIIFFDDLSSVGSSELQQFLQNLEEGYIYSAGGINNLLEGDFFSWYANDAQWSIGLFYPIRDIVSQIALYSDEFSSRMETLDLFKDLYMDFIPQEVRHSLGEYYTPTWLAEHLIEVGIDLPDLPERWRGIDPCCGSGVFLLAMIQEIIGDRQIADMDDAQKRAVLDDILDRVTGIDINPLSVLTARVNYFLSIRDLIPEGMDIEIPVYVGDSAVIPISESIDGIACFTCSIRTAKAEISATLPQSFVRDSHFMSKMNKIQRTVRTEDPGIITRMLAENVGSDSESEILMMRFSEFADSLVKLQKENWDGIWVRIISNFLMVAKTQDIDLIIGNPPWVKWEYLPSAYAEKLKSLCFERHLFSGQSYMGAISLNICAPIANLTAAGWLNEKGAQIFLMPKNLLTQDSYEGFRNFSIPNSNHGERLYLQMVEDWSKAGKVFDKATEPCCTFIYGFKVKDYSKGVVVRSFSKKTRTKIRSQEHWSEVEGCFDVEEKIAIQLNEERTGFSIVASGDRTRLESLKLIVGRSFYRARTGVEFVPNEVTLVDPIGEANDQNMWRFRNIPLSASLHKALPCESFALERAFVRPVLEAPNIADFHIIESSKCCVFPYEGRETFSIRMDRLEELAPATLEYLLDHKKLFNRQSERSKSITRGDEFYALSKIGDYTYGENMVVFRDNTRLSAAVVEPVKMPWGEKKMPIPAKHAALISMRANGEFIDSEEAYYISGILNSPIVQEYFAATYSGRSYSIKLGIKIPLFDSGDRRHSGISSLSKKAHLYARKGESVQEISREIENLYLDICRSC